MAVRISRRGFSVRSLMHYGSSSGGGGGGGRESRRRTSLNFLSWSGSVFVFVGGWMDGG